MVGLEVASFIFGAILLTIALLGAAIDISFLQVGTKGPVSRETRIVTGVLGVTFIVIGFLTRSNGSVLPPSAPTEVVIVPSASPTAQTISTATISLPTETATITPPSPSSTPTTVSEELLALSTSWEIVASDTFNNGTNKYNWVTGMNPGSEGDTAEIAINGKYYVDIETTNGTSWSPFFSTFELPPAFFLEVDVKRTQEEGCYAAVVWGGDNRLSFRVDDVDREFSLNYYDTTEQKYIDLKGWTFHDAIVPGEVNRLSVISDGNSYILYVNDQFVTDGVLNSTATGKFGFQTAVCNEDSQVTFEFDNLEVRIPPTPLAMTIDPSVVFFDQGYAEFNNKEYQSAIDDFKSALTFGYRIPSQANYFLGRSYSAVNNNTEAIIYYSKAIDGNYQPLAEVYNRRGLSQKAQKLYLEAINDFTKSIQLDHNPITWPYINRGEAYYDNGDYQNAIKDYTKAIELEHSPLGYAYVSRASAYKKLNDLDSAFRDYETAIQIGYVEAYRARGQTYVNLEDYESAISDYTTGLEKGATNIYFYYDRGIAYQRANDVENARLDFEKFLELEQNSEYWRNEAMKMLEELNK